METGLEALDPSHPEVAAQSAQMLGRAIAQNMCKTVVMLTPCKAPVALLQLIDAAQHH